MFKSDEEELEAVRRVLLSKNLFRYHDASALGECDLFEKEFATYLGNPHALMVTSGTNALVLALLACGVGPGDEVLVPTFTFYATAAAVVQVGATVILVNIDSSLCLSPLEAEKKITEKTKAMIPVHMDGVACDMKALSELAAKHKLFLIEDCAQAMGGSFQGKKLGTWGDFGCFSLNVDKILSCGEGGVITCKDRTLYEKALCFHDGASQFNPVKKNEYKNIKPFFGHSMRVSEISGAIMRVQLKRLETILTGLRERKKILSSVGSILGNDPQGDCGTSLHLKCRSVEETQILGKKLRDAGIVAIPINARPAHAFWQWAHLFNDKVNDKKTYAVARYLESLDHLTTVLKIEIELDWSLSETEALALKIKAALL